MFNFFENVNFSSSYKGLSVHQFWFNLGQGKQSYGGGRNPTPPQVENVLNRPGEMGLRNSSRMRKAELVVLFQNSGIPEGPRAPAPRTRPPPPPPPTQTWETVDDRRPRVPSPQEMDIFEQQEISKSRPQVKTKLNKWYDWLINHVPKPIKDGASKAFKTFKHKVMGLYNRVSGSTGNETRI